MTLSEQQIQHMNVHMLLSIINMKLRNEFDGLIGLCQFYALDQATLEDKLKQGNYQYQASLNQFR